MVRYDAYSYNECEIETLCFNAKCVSSTQQRRNQKKNEDESEWWQCLSNEMKGE